MKSTLKLLTTLTAVLVLSSFTGNTTMDYIGTYGVPASDPSQIRLTINADHTFTYQDFSVADRKVAIEGRWTQNGKKVVLNSGSDVAKFHDVWTFEEDGQIAKSRKGLSFYRLCKVEG